MAQAFVSTYKNHYRWHNQARTALVDPDKLTKLAPEGDIWLLDANQEIEKELKNLPKIEKAIKNLYLKRMKTTYQISYCDNIKTVSKPPKSFLSELNIGQPIEETQRQEDKESHEDLGNELLEYCRKIYDHKVDKIMPPLNSSRNVFGYMRPSRLLTPLTMYQNEYGRVGFKVLNAGYNEKQII